MFQKVKISCQPGERSANGLFFRRAYFLRGPDELFGSPFGISDQLVFACDLDRRKTHKNKGFELDSKSFRIKNDHRLTKFLLIFCFLISMEIYGGVNFGENAFYKIILGLFYYSYEYYRQSFGMHVRPSDYVNPVVYNS